MTQEVELKLLLENIEERDRLAQALGKRVARVQQANMYFDTMDDGLSRHKWALRIRDEDGRTTLTLKGKGSVDGEYVVRIELDRALTQDDWLKAIRGELDIASEVRALLEGSEHSLPEGVDLDSLEKLGMVSNTRSVYSLPGTPLMVELDETEYPDFSLQYEAELEVPDGEDREAASQILRTLFDEVGVPWRPSSDSKYARFRAILASMMASERRD